MTTDTEHKEMTAGMRALLWLAVVLVGLAGIQLFVFAERTERFFAWTIDPPLTAAFLGAGYWASIAFEWSAARQRLWANARVAVPTVLVFTVLTLIVTLVHIDRFHLGAEFEAATRAVTWTWIAVYLIVPVALTYVLVAQRRASGEDPPRQHTLPGWLRVLVAAQALVLVAVGAALLIAPEAAAPIWPWSLTALTGRAIGAWVISLGVAAAHALWENDVPRLRPAAWAFVAFGILQGVAVARYPGTIDWSSVPAWGFVAVLVSAVVAGAATLRLDGVR